MQFVAAGVTARSSSSSQTSHSAKHFNGDSHLDEKSRSERSLVDSASCQSLCREACEKRDGFQRVLIETGVRELRYVRVELSDGHVRLNGRVPTFYAKQLAQEALRPYAIGLKIDNQLAVDLPS